MLSCPHHHLRHRHHPSLLHHHRKPNSSAATPHLSSSLLHNHQQTPQNLTTIPRTHNSKTKLAEVISPEQKLMLQELTPSHKRPPKFPGSVTPHPTTSSPLQTLFQENNDLDAEGEEEMIMRAIEMRRGLTAEILKEEMIRKGKFGITYSSNLIDRLEGFLDFVMIEAAALKRLPEFEVSSFNVRARTVIQELEVVPLIRWLKHNRLSYPKIAKLICMARGNLESIRRLADWLKLNHVKGDFLGVVLMKAGDNILQRGTKELDVIVEYLQSNGVRGDWMGYVISRCPQLLSCSMEELKTRVGFYLDMGMNEKDFGTMVFDYPGVLGRFTLEEMSQKVDYLMEFGLSNEEVGRLLAFKPQLMGCSIEYRWKPLVKYLYYLGISRDGMRRMLTIKPMIFCFDFEATIVPKVRFFQDIGIRDDAIGNMLVKFPPLLTYSLYKKIRPVVIFLMTKAGVGEKDIAKVIASGPELLGCSVAKKLEGNLKYFLSLGIRHQQLGEMIADFPMLLRYNIDLLRPKYSYLRRTMVRPLQDVIEFPRFFSYSLEERIIPRYKVMVENRINFKLRYMLACSDEEFQKKVQAAVERRQRFESGIMEDTLSSSYVANKASEERVNHSLEDEIDFSDPQINNPSTGTRNSDFPEIGDSENMS